MDYHGFKAMLNRYYARHVGGDARPVFFDIEQTFPALGAVTAAYPTIRAELDRLLDGSPALPKYHEVDPGEAEISDTPEPGQWSVFMLDCIGHKPEANRALCPQTCQALDQVPSLMQAFFSILDPGKSIPLHEGPYLGYLRYHLALRVPGENPPTLWLNDQPYTWREGEAVLFDDSWPHRVENSASEPRAVLVVDVLRPMPTMPALVNRLTTNLLVAPIYGRQVAKRVRQYKKAA